MCVVMKPTNALLPVDLFSTQLEHVKDFLLRIMIFLCVYRQKEAVLRIPGKHIPDV